MDNKVAEYYFNHARCPQCGTLVPKKDTSGVSVEETNYDGNRAICPSDDCDWQGVIHELKPREISTELAESDKLE